MRYCQKRRGVGEIVTVLLLVAIVVSLGVLLFTFASGSLSSLAGGFSGVVTSRGSAAAERLVVEDVAFTFSGTQGADVYVRNVGATSSTLVSVFVVDQSTGALIAQVPISTAVSAGGLVEISHTVYSGLAFAPTPGQTYSFTVTSSLGNSAKYYEEAL